MLLPLATYASSWKIGSILIATYFGLETNAIGASRNENVRSGDSLSRRRLPIPYPSA